MPKKSTPVSESEISDVVVYSPADDIAQAFNRLIESRIIEPSDSQIVWRTGHLEHLARLYLADARLVWRDYGDDMLVAQNADGTNWSAMLEQLKAE